jgi:signal peptidase I
MEHTRDPAAVVQPEDGTLAVPLTRSGRRAQAAAKARERRRAARDWIILVVVALLVAVVVRQFVFQLFYIPSESMVPQLEVGDQVFVNKLAYDLGDPERGDLVVFEKPDDWQDVPVDDLVKRIVALPGERIEGRQGRVFVDGEPLAEPYLPSGTSTSSFGPITVARDHYFMMGDNRSGSNDSRMHAAVDRDLFVGKVFMTVWPLDRLSIPMWVVIVVAGAVVALVAVWVLAGRRRDVTEAPDSLSPPTR